MTRQILLELEIGGQELRCSGVYSKGRPATRLDPEDPPELEISLIELLIGVEGNRHRFLDITDLVEELGGLDIVQQKAYEDYEPEPDVPDEDRDDFRHFL